MLKFRQAIIVLVAELWFCTSNVECDANFTECYNTTTEMHCFSKIVDGAVNFTEAQKRCSAIDATLPVIKNEEVQTMLETFISYLGNSNGIEDSISFFWTDANRIMEPKWQWLNSSVINELNASVNTGIFSFDIHVASLASQESDQQEVRLIENIPGERFCYICEFYGSDCQSQNGNVLRYGDKCYVASKDNATWYDARNRCLKERGDLASFGDLNNTNIDFTQWLDLSNRKQYWVGVRLFQWLWKISEVRYTNWFRRYPVPMYKGDECVCVYLNSGISSEIHGWRTTDSHDPSVGVICHKVTSHDPTKDTTLALSDSSIDTRTLALSDSSKYSTTVALFDSSKDTISNCSGCANTPNSLESSAADSKAIALGVGIGLGLGIPVVIAIIVIIVVCVKRKRKFRPSGNNVAANSHDYELKDPQTD